jgi:NADH dehydrogenase
MPVENQPSGSRPKVVIIGGGFAGVGAAQALKGSGAQILLLDGKNHHCFQPLLYQRDNVSERV